MRAMVFDTPGDPSVLRIEERPRPVPGETDLLVEVHASSVNPVDTKVRRNGPGPRTTPAPAESVTSRSSSRSCTAAAY